MAWRFRWVPPGGTIANDAYVMDVVRFRSFIGGSQPPYNVVNEEQPFRPGSYLKTITVDEAQVYLTMILKGTSATSLWESMAILPALFNPTRTDTNGNFGGRLIVTTPASGLSRALSCVCLSGFKIDEATLQQNSVEATLEFYANYPYWQSTVIQESTGTPFGKIPEWFPIFPLILGGASTNFVEVTVNNAGDVPAYPTIVINGPGSGIRIFNKAFGAGEADFKLTANGVGNNGVVLANNTQSLTINMLAQTVVRNTGVSEVNKLTYDSTFFPLKPGDNTLRFEFTGTTSVSAQTRITINWQNTYSGVI